MTTWQLPSSDGKRTYTVRHDEHGWHCTCPARAFGRGKPCKHILRMKGSDMTSGTMEENGTLATTPRQQPGSLAAAYGAFSPNVLAEQVQLIQQAMEKVMLDGQHYGKIPGCGDKPTLLKPGAEKLAMLFRLALEIDVTKTDLGGGHREYEVKCRLRSIQSGAYMGEGVGSCSTMESKYRYRNVSDFDILDEPIPPDAKERKQEYRKQGLGMKKTEHGWAWVRYKDTGKTENPDLADVYNTCLKMAKKRACVDAVLTATAASDIFAQDLEDLPRDEHHEPPRQPAPAPRAEPVPRLSEGQAKVIEALLAAHVWNRAKLLQSYNAERIEDIPASEFERIKSFVEKAPLRKKDSDKPADAEDLARLETAKENAAGDPHLIEDIAKEHKIDLKRLSKADVTFLCAELEKEAEVPF